MSTFRNPYHFIPIPDGPPPESVPLKDFSLPHAQRAARHVTHDRFVAGEHSGRLVCKLTVETPLICGNQQEERGNQTKLLHPFEIAGSPAIPGSALRGMLSTLAEAATHSALRVLKDTALSHRMAAAAESLSAIGLLVQHKLPDGTTKLRLQPLTVPTLDGNGGDQLPASFEKVFQSKFSQPLLKAYVGGYKPRTDGRGTPIRPGEVEQMRGSFLATRNPASRSADNLEYWYAQLSGTVSLSKNCVAASAPQRDSRKKRFLLAQQVAGAPISQAEFDALPASRQATYTRGFLRVLGISNRAREIPTTKKHEYFIPYPPGSETAIPTFDVEAALGRFHRLADQRTEVDPALPFEPQGSSRNAAPARSRNMRLRAGDLVFFRPDPSNPTTIVEVSVSSIWRADNGSVHDYFAIHDPELTPLARGRSLLTLAEQLFGAVEIGERKKKDGDSPSTFALASRLRVSHAWLSSAPDPKPYYTTAEELTPAGQDRGHRGPLRNIPLKNLASPKPPSPALYFKKRNGDGTYIAKRALNPNQHAPQGVKIYLRRNPDAYSAVSEAFVHPARLRDPDQRDAIVRQHQSVEKLVRPGCTFYFHLDFDNLSALELQLFAYVLQPSPGFRHQLGHGKPLGLGQVKIETVGLLEVSRTQRYREDALIAERWHDAWGAGNAQTEWPEDLKARLPKGIRPVGEKLAELKAGFEKWAAGAGLSPMLRALELAGTPPADGIGVHYPQIDGASPGSPQFEQEHYHWFVQNDDSSKGRSPGQFLAPLVNAVGQVASALPTLRREKSNSPPPTSYVGPAQPRRPSGQGPSPGKQAPRAPVPDEASTAPLSPQALVGKEVTACALAPGKDKKILFTVSHDGKELAGIRGFVEVSRYETAQFAARHPEGTVIRAKVVRPFGKTLLIKPLP